MAWLGHSTSKAALIYQHAVKGRDQTIALALDEIARAASKPNATVSRLRR